ncbi:hypothetical protein BDQ17DRAFT_1341003 [Cyathus striatus]|nr:hypothetical protein BDQ17DRAFT_1341003 [Cyathus striatus]
MTTRPSRSSSISLPRSPSLSSARNIESVISIPPPSRSRFPITHPVSNRPIPIPESHRSQGIHGSRAAAMGPSSISPATHPAARSLSLSSSVHGRPGSQWGSSFEPRVIRSGTELVHGDMVCPSSMSSRRFNTSGNAPRTAANQHTLPQMSPAPFPRPSYLEHSVLRNMLQVESSHKTDIPRHPQGFVPAMSPSVDSDDDSNASLPPQHVHPISSSTVPLEGCLKLPARWSEEHRNANLSVSSDGRELIYMSSSCAGEKDAAAARTAAPIPHACGIYYYEVEIIGKESRGHISVGFIGGGVKYSRLPGWEPNSWGYHGDDGCSFATERNGTPYGPTYGAGDVVGCGIDFTTNKAFFTKNGVLIGDVFENVGKDTDLYPSVGIQHTGESVRANFGHDPFKYDIDYHVRRRYSDTWSTILRTPIDSAVLKGELQAKNEASHSVTTEDSGAIINRLVLSYLIHHGYAKTARAFQKQDKLSVSKDDRDVEMSDSGSCDRRNLDGIENDIERRTSIVKSISCGDIDAAIEMIREHYSDVLETDSGIMFFKLRCRKFVELILETTEMKKRLVSNQEPLSQMYEPPYNLSSSDGSNWMDEDVMGMDVDEDSMLLGSPATTTAPQSRTSMHGLVMPLTVDSSSAIAMAEHYEAALNNAISYGQTLQDDFKMDERAEVQQLFKQTFGIVAWENPLEVGGATSEVVGHQARVTLANEVNQMILRSQGRPVRPALETMYRHTTTCIQRLGILGVGMAAFADIPKEFREM